MIEVGFLLPNSLESFKELKYVGTEIITWKGKKRFIIRVFLKETFYFHLEKDISRFGTLYLLLSITKLKKKKFYYWYFGRCGLEKADRETERPTKRKNPQLLIYSPDASPTGPWRSLEPAKQSKSLTWKTKTQLLEPAAPQGVRELESGVELMPTRLTCGHPDGFSVSVLNPYPCQNPHN